MRARLPAVLLLLAGGCGEAPPLPPPGAAQPVAIQVWDADGRHTATIVVERMRQEGARLDRLQLAGIRARLRDGELDWQLSAPGGTWETARGTLTLAAPVRLIGTWREAPMLGRAEGATFHRSGQDLTLDAVELWGQGQRTIAPRLVLTRDRRLEAPQGLVSEPLPPHAAALLAALPPPSPLTPPPASAPALEPAPQPADRR